MSRLATYVAVCALVAFAPGLALASATAVAVADVTSGALPLSVHFDGSGSSTDHPSGNLVYAWDLDSDGVFDDATGVSATWQYEVAGVFSVSLRVRDDDLDIDIASILITAGNEAPSLSILEPGSGDAWTVGEVILLEAEVIDAEEGALPDSAVSWEITLEECATGPCQVTPLASIDGATGSFVAPSAGLPAVLEICLGAEDGGFPAGTMATWPYRKTITIDPELVAGTTSLLDFPVLVELSDPDLRHTVSGGGVGTPDGHDIVFTTGAGGKLDHEIEHYEPTSGSLVAWVRIPTLSAVTATQILVHYGNPAVPPQADPHGVWSPTYSAVWHLGDAPADQDLVLDSTENDVDGTFHDANGNSDGSAAGRIGRGLVLAGDEDYVDLGQPTALPAGLAARTLCAWGRGSGAGSHRWLAAYGSPLTGGAFFIGESSDGITLQAGGFGSDLLFFPFWDTTTWHHACLTYSGSAARLYGDGALRAAQVATWDLVPGKAYLGRQVNDVEYWSGGLDEVRIASRALSAAWIATEYANQSSPAAFYTVGPQESVPASLPIGGWPLSSSTCLDLHPATVDLTFATEPTGLELIVNGESATAPLVRTYIVGTSVSIEASQFQQKDGLNYGWDSWSDGGERAHEIVAPDTPATLVASFSGFEIGVETLLDEMTDLVRLAEPFAPLRSQRLASSYDRASDPPCLPGAPCWFANGDVHQYIGEETHDGHVEHVLLDAGGPGAIEHVWFAEPQGFLRLYVDGSSTPALTAYLPALLSGTIPPFIAPLAHHAFPGNGGNLYFPFPFAEHCKVTWETNAPIAEQYYRVEYRQYPETVVVRSFSMEQALTASDKIEQVAGLLSTPRQVYQPSPDHVHHHGVLPANEQPQVFSAAGGSSTGAVVRELRLRPVLLDEATLRTTLLEISFDGKKTVSAPLGDFFGSGPGLNPHDSLPLSVQGDGTMVSRWPMPFQGEMTLELTRADGPRTLVEYDVLVEPYAWGPETLLFHATWRSDYEVYAHGPQDWNFVTVEGRGHYVGDLLNVASPYLSWWGEGDEKIYVDGETFPGQFGVGSEDYYGFGWASTEPFQHAYHAQTRADGSPGLNYGRASVNRWRIFDSVPFEQELRFDFEQLWSFPTSDERRTLYDVLTYYYADPESTNNHPPLQAEDLQIPLIPPLETKFFPGIVLEGEQMEVLAATGLTIPQLTQEWELDGVLWSEHFHMFWILGEIGDELRLGFDVPAAGAYCLQAYLTHGPHYATFDLELDGEIVAPGVDLEKPDGTWPAPPLPLGIHELEAGAHELGALIVSGGPQWKIFGIDALTLLPAGMIPQISLDRTALHVVAAVSTAYDFVVGDLAVLRASGGDFSLATTACLADGAPGPSLSHSQIPRPGQGWFFLARVDDCAPGTFDSGGPGQQGSRDGEIGASPAACP